MYRQAVIALAIEILSTCAGAKTFADPLDVPSTLTKRAASSLMLAVAPAGKRLVAVGELGRITVSDDAGRNWRQVKTPVSVDLVAVCFPTANEGWAVGHAGVILHSSDGGQSWRRQLDGRDAKTLIQSYYQQRVSAGASALEPFLRDVDLNFKNGPEQPFLGVWFRNERDGFAVGGFGLILATSDGGKSWVPWMDRVDNPDALHLNGIQGVGDDVLIVGEHGMVWKLDVKAQRFVAHGTNYKGSLFGIVGNSNALVAYGLQGKAFASTDGAASWQPIALPTQANINSAANLGDGRIVMVTQGGSMLVGAIQSKDFQVKTVANPSLLAGVAPAGPGAVVVVGLSGVQREALPPMQQAAVPSSQERR